jgi:hypothetical protein
MYITNKKKWDTQQHYQSRHIQHPGLSRPRFSMARPLHHEQPILHSQGHHQHLSVIPRLPPSPLQASDINTMVQTMVRALQLDKKGFPPDAVNSHSLRAGGAMDMHLNHIEWNTIRKQGRWSSDTFLMYIHEQSAAFSAGVFSRMSQGVGWFHIEGPTITNH